MKANIGLIGTRNLTIRTNSTFLTSPASRPNRTVDDNAEIVTESKGTQLTFVDCSGTLRVLVCSSLLRRAELLVFLVRFPVEACQSKHLSERY